MRIMGWLAAILGVIGLIVCLVIAVGVWFVKPEVETRVDRLATAVVEGLDQAAVLSAEASELVVQVNERLDTVAETASSISANPILDAVVDRVLGGAINRVVSGPWNEIQDRLGGLRERVVGLSSVVQSIDQAVPFIELPGVVTGFIDDVDARWTELDQTVGEMQTIADEGVGTAERAARVAEIATNASQRLDTVNLALGEVHGKIETAQADITQGAQRVGNGLTWVALIVCIVAIWVALLHLLLISQGRRWIREER